MVLQLPTIYDGFGLSPFCHPLLDFAEISAEGILYIWDLNAAWNSGKRLFEARILGLNYWVDSGSFFPAMEAPAKFTLKKSFSSQDPPPKIQPRSGAKILALHHSRPCRSSL